MVRTIPQAQTSARPRARGEDRFRARATVSRRHISAYSSFKCRLQKASVKAVIASYFGRTSDGIAVDGCDKFLRAIMVIPCLRSFILVRGVPQPDQLPFINQHLPQHVIIIHPEIGRLAVLSQIFGRGEQIPLCSSLYAAKCSLINNTAIYMPNIAIILTLFFPLIRLLPR